MFTGSPGKGSKTGILNSIVFLKRATIEFNFTAISTTFFDGTLLRCLSRSVRGLLVVGANSYFLISTNSKPDFLLLYLSRAMIFSLRVCDGVARFTVGRGCNFLPLYFNTLFSSYFTKKQFTYSISR